MGFCTGYCSVCCACTADVVGTVLDVQRSAVQVQQFVTRRRIELNEAREAAGLDRIYLLGKDGIQLGSSKEALRNRAQLQ